MANKRSYFLKHAYGITPADEEAMLVAQGGACAICGAKPKKVRLSVDHCHVTRRVRGLLCQSCNMLMGRIDALGVAQVAVVVDRLRSYALRSKVIRIQAPAWSRPARVQRMAECHPERKHWCKGLCSSCYTAARLRARRARAA